VHKFASQGDRQLPTATGSGTYSGCASATAAC
jgi:hypothetical protein